MVGSKSWARCCHTDHEKLAEGDVGEDVVRLVLAAGDARLLPEVRELLKQRPAGPQVQNVLPGQGIVQERVVHVGEEPGAKDTSGQPKLSLSVTEGRTFSGQQREALTATRSRQKSGQHIFNVLFQREFQF